MRKLLVSVLFLFFLSIIHSSSAFAKSTLVCSENYCSKNKLFLFENKSLWYPGKWQTDYLEIKNKSKKFLYLQILPKAKIIKQKNCQIEDYFQLLISQLSLPRKAGVVWGGSLKDFYNEKAIQLYPIKGKRTERLRFLLSLNQNTPNSCQGKKATLSLHLLLKILPEREAFFCKTPVPKAPKIEGAKWKGQNILRIVWGISDSKVRFYLLEYKKGGRNTLIPNVGTGKTTWFDLFLPDKRANYEIHLYSGRGCSLSPPSNKLIVAGGKIIFSNDIRFKKIKEKTTSLFEITKKREGKPSPTSVSPTSFQTKEKNKKNLPDSQPTPEIKPGPLKIKTLAIKTIKEVLKKVVEKIKITQTIVVKSLKKVGLPIIKIFVSIFKLIL